MKTCFLPFQAFAQAYTLDTPRAKIEAERVQSYYSVQEVPSKRAHHGILGVFAPAHGLQFFDEGAE